MKKYRLILVVAGLFSTGIWARNPTFHPTSEAPFVASPISKHHALSIGISFSSIAPLSAPYSSTVSGTAKDSSYQMPTAFSVEAGYQLRNDLELALSVGYQNYESRVDIPAGTNSLAYQSISLHAVPVLVLGRYRSGDPMGWAPEFEVGAGLSFGTLSMDSTNRSAQESTATLRTAMFYGSAGAGFAWLEDYSLHFSVGYGVLAQGTHTYTTLITQQTLSGVFSKALVKYAF